MPASCHTWTCPFHGAGNKSHQANDLSTRGDQLNVVQIDALLALSSPMQNHAHFHQHHHWTPLAACTLHVVTAAWVARLEVCSHVQNSSESLLLGRRACRRQHADQAFSAASVFPLSSQLGPFKSMLCSDGHAARKWTGRAPTAPLPVRQGPGNVAPSWLGHQVCAALWLVGRELYMWYCKAGVPRLHGSKDTSYNAIACMAQFSITKVCVQC